MIKYFCVSDIHSFYDELIYALNNKNFDINNKDHKLIICGDAFDRGDQSIKIFEFMKKLNNEDRLIYIKGNHEDLLFDCINELVSYGKCGGHHYSNGTVKTLSHFINEDDYWVYSTYIPTNVIESITNNTKELRNFIQENSRNYFTLGNKIFVHSWLPIYNDIEKGNIIWEDWDKYELESNSLWRNAMWGNPFLMWKSKLYPEDKCIVFGHFHTSYGNSRIDMKCKEWPEKNRKNWQDSFKPWVKENAIGIDACCAYSGFINCIIFDENGNIVEESC